MAENITIAIPSYTVTNGLHDEDEDDYCAKPSAKKHKADDSTDHESLKQLVYNLNRTVTQRLDIIESKLEAMQGKTRELEDKVEAILNHMVATQNVAITKQEQDATPNENAPIVVGVSNPVAFSPGASCSPDMPKLYDSLGNSLANSVGGPRVTLITLNREDDYPDGTWLGDENCPEMRVRVPISPSDLLHIHSNCRSAEKMALTLLDYLFDRETQAVSNLSGLGKHGKKQLDPLMIYGIRCHLIRRFGILEVDWHRIKQNMDSKCRTAFRRKQRGLPLTVKAFRGKVSSSGAPGHDSDPGRDGLLGYMQGIHDLSGDEDSLQQADDSDLHQLQRDGLDVVTADEGMITNLAQIIQQQQRVTSPGCGDGVSDGDGGGGGQIQVLHATPEQLAQLQQSHQIQILQGDQLIGQLANGQEGEVSLQVRVSLPNDDDKQQQHHQHHHHHQQNGGHDSLQQQLTSQQSIVTVGDASQLCVGDPQHSLIVNASGDTLHTIITQAAAAGGGGVKTDANDELHAKANVTELILH